MPVDNHVWFLGKLGKGAKQFGGGYLESFHIEVQFGSTKQVPDNRTRVDHVGKTEDTHPGTNTSHLGTRTIIDL